MRNRFWTIMFVVVAAVVVGNTTGWELFGDRYYELIFVRVLPPCFGRWLSAIFVLKDMDGVWNWVACSGAIASAIGLFLVLPRRRSHAVH